METSIRKDASRQPRWIRSIIAARMAEVLEREVLEQIEDEFGILSSK